jgi:hypothetical protein
MSEEIFEQLDHRSGCPFSFCGVCPSANFFKPKPLKKVDLQVKRFPQEWKGAAFALYMCYNICQIWQFELSSL